MESIHERLNSTYQIISECPLVQSHDSAEANLSYFTMCLNRITPITHDECALSRECELLCNKGRGPFMTYIKLIGEPGMCLYSDPRTILLMLGLQDTIYLKYDLSKNAFIAAARDSQSSTTGEDEDTITSQQNQDHRSAPVQYPRAEGRPSKYDRNKPEYRDLPRDNSRGRNNDGGAPRHFSDQRKTSQDRGGSRGGPSADTRSGAASSGFASLGSQSNGGESQYNSRGRDRDVGQRGGSRGGARGVPQSGRDGGPRVSGHGRAFVKNGCDSRSGPRQNYPPHLDAAPASPTPGAAPFTLTNDDYNAILAQFSTFDPDAVAVQNWADL